MTESDPTARMTTLSMLGSACAFETEASLPLYCISNLAALIELLCLYETTYVLGSVPKSLVASEFVGELLRIGFVRDVSTRRVRGSIFSRERIGAIAAGRLDQVLGIG